MKKFEILLLLAILAIAFVLRLYEITRPLADWHSWRQADTASVARNFTKGDFNPLIPKFDDMSSQANGLDNPNRYRFVEFPVYNLIIASVWKFTGANVTVARLITVLITLISTSLLYFLVKEFSGQKIAILSAFFFATIPYNVFYSSTILPGPLMVMELLALYLFFAKWLKTGKMVHYLLAIICASLAILTWPIAIFFMLPIVYIASSKLGLGVFKIPKIWIFTILSILPFILWRIWILNFPEGIPNWQFLLNEGNIRFKGAFFRWIFAERLGKLILTVAGFPLFILGLVLKPKDSEGFFYYSWIASVILYLVVFASGNVRHDYYQVPIIPILSIFLAKGVHALFSFKSSVFSKLTAPTVALFLIVLMYAFGFYEVRGFYWINKPQIVQAGQAADRLLPKDAKVIAPYRGDAAFLYQTNRYGYPIVDRPLEKFIDQGTKYLVSVDVNDAGIQNLAKHCKVIDQTQNYVIVEMFKECIGR